jgi:hypothetical protein
MGTSVATHADLIEAVGAMRGDVGIPPVAVEARRTRQITAVRMGDSPPDPSPPNKG